MKIGILTLPLHNNYGGILQNYALQQVLIKLGHEVETIDWNVKYGRFKVLASRCKLWLFTYLTNKKKETPRYNPSDEEFRFISQNTHRFVKKYLRVSPTKVTRQKNLNALTHERGYEAFVVGSDQVWRPSYNAWMSSFFLDFTQGEKIRRVAYAASFGTSKWEFSKSLTERCARLVKKFDLITVREISGVQLCKDYLGVDAKHVLDPTMLLIKEDYIKLIGLEQEPQCNGTLFHYILDPFEVKNVIIQEMAEKNRLVPFTIMPTCQTENRTKWDIKNRIEECVYPPVTKWLRGFMDAKLVVVDSFHGAVFSIIFNKPFWVLENPKRGNARFKSLLEMFGLENRMISTDIYPNIDLKDMNIDWMKVNEVMARKRSQCINMLKNSLI